MNGEWLVRLTIWLAVAAWLLRVFIEATGRAFSRRDRLIRWAWFGGAIACTTHVVCAMGFAHCWSLGNAMRHTAQVTRQVMGVELPSSVFVNFAFTLLWLVDGWLVFRSTKPRPMGFARHFIWAVMMINGTVVFGPRYWMWIAVPCVAALMVVLCRRESRNSG